MNVEFSQIVLLKQEKALLKKFHSDSLIPLTNERAVGLKRHGLITENCIGYNDIGEAILDGKFRLTDYGKRYKQYLAQANRQHRINEIRNWITAVIAVLGLILSITNLIWKEWK